MTKRQVAHRLRHLDGRHEGGWKTRLGLTEGLAHHRPETLHRFDDLLRGKGEAVKACVQLKPGASVGAEALIAWAKEGVGSMKAPKSVDFIDSLPRSPVGKVLKRDLRVPYWAGKTRGVG